MNTNDSQPFLHILLVDPLVYKHPALETVLRRSYHVSVAQIEEDVLQVLKYQVPSMIIIDAADKNLDYLRLIEEYDTQTPLLLVGLHPDDEYTGEGFQRSALKMWIEHTIVSRQLHTEVATLEPQEQQVHKFGDFTTCSKQLIPIFRILEHVVNTDVPVLITGESGTGKELIARGLHDLSMNKKQAFIAINCAAIPENLLETELFGYEKGAFTGANSTKIGKLEYAGSGTVFLDEIGDMPILTQAKILRVLQERVFERVGGHQPIYFRARLIAATNKNLAEEIVQRTFREDLFYRLNTVCVELPPLRERDEDIPLLTEYFLHTFSQHYNKNIAGISPSVLDLFQKYDWPGNVRELFNCVHHAVLLSDSPRIELKDLPSQFQPGIKAVILLDQLGKVPLDTIVERAKKTLESQIITKVLEKFNYNKLQTSYYLSIDRKTLYRKIKELNIPDEKPKDF